MSCANFQVPSGLSSSTTMISKLHLAASRLLVIRVMAFARLEDSLYVGSTNDIVTVLAASLMDCICLSTSRSTPLDHSDNRGDGYDRRREKRHRGPDPFRPTAVKHKPKILLSAAQCQLK
jgi:hypothetical protein